MKKIIWQPTLPSITAKTLYDALADCPATVLHFWAEWDVYSRSLDARLKEYHAVLAPQIAFFSVDVDKEINWQVCSRYDIQTTPTLLFFTNAILRDNYVCLKPSSHLENQLALWQVAAYEPL